MWMSYVISSFLVLYETSQRQEGKVGWAFTLHKTTNSTRPSQKLFFVSSKESSCNPPREAHQQQLYTNTYSTSTKLYNLVFILFFYYYIAPSITQNGVGPRFCWLEEKKRASCISFLKKSSNVAITLISFCLPLNHLIIS